jgi:hypothetical protein
VYAEPRHYLLQFRLQFRHERTGARHLPAPAFRSAPEPRRSHSKRATGRPARGERTLTRPPAIARSSRGAALVRGRRSQVVPIPIFGCLSGWLERYHPGPDPGFQPFASVPMSKLLHDRHFSPD